MYIYIYIYIYILFNISLVQTSIYEKQTQSEVDGKTCQNMKFSFPLLLRAFLPQFN